MLFNHCFSVQFPCLTIAWTNNVNICIRIKIIRPFRSKLHGRVLNRTMYTSNASFMFLQLNNKFIVIRKLARAGTSALISTKIFVICPLPNYRSTVMACQWNTNILNNYFWTTSVAEYFLTLKPEDAGPQYLVGKIKSIHIVSWKIILIYINHLKSKRCVPLKCWRLDMNSVHITKNILIWPFIDYRHL